MGCIRMAATVETASQGNAQTEQSSNSACEDLFASDQFRMFAYKILPCAKRTSHEWTTCPFAHPGEKARRRDPRVYNYLAIPCEATKQGGTCPRGDDCPNCHSLFEYWLHPSRYRTQLCRDMEGGHCKRQVCFFAHSIDELRVPDHSHLTIPPEMQQQAPASGASSTTASADAHSTGGAATDSSSSSSSSSTPRAGSKDTRAYQAAGGGASKPPRSQPSSPCTGVSGRAVNMSSHSHNRQAKGPRNSNNSPILHSPVNAPPSMHWAGYAGTPAAAALVSHGSSSAGSPTDLYACSLLGTPSLEQQRAALQAQLQQNSAALSRSRSMYEQQLQVLLANESAQQTQQLLALHQSQQAAVWSAQMARLSSVPNFGDFAGGVQGGSPPLSPMPAGLLDTPSPYSAQGYAQNLFVPPSASSGALSAMAGAAASWTPAGLLRTESTPVSSSLTRQTSGLPPSATANQFSSAGAQVQLQQAHVSGGSTVCDSQEMTLASLLGCSPPTGNWSMAPGTPSVSLGGDGSLGLGYEQSRQQMGVSTGGLLASSSGLYAAGWMMLQQQQKAAANVLQQSINRGGLADCNTQVMNDVIGLMMQQLLLQRPSVAV